MKELIIKKRPFEEEEVAFIARGLLQAIAYCHSRGIVHRDIRPENILVEIPENKPVQGLKLISFKEAVEIKPPTATPSNYTPISN